MGNWGTAPLKTRAWIHKQKPLFLKGLRCSSVTEKFSSSCEALGLLSSTARKEKKNNKKKKCVHPAVLAVVCYVYHRILSPLGHLVDECMEDERDTCLSEDILWQTSAKLLTSWRHEFNPQRHPMVVRSCQVWLPPQLKWVLLVPQPVVRRKWNTRSHSSVWGVRVLSCPVEQMVLTNRR